MAVQEKEQNNTFAQAQDLGSFKDNSSIEVTGTVSLSDVNDVYQISLREPSSNVELVLTQNSSNNSDADLEFFRDANRNNTLDQGDFIINAFEQPQGGTKQLKLIGLSGGAYFIRVRMDRGSDVGSGPINYKLTVRVDAGRQVEQESNNSIPQAEEIKGYLNGQRLIKGSVDRASDSVDFYKFKVEVPSRLSTSISTSNSSNLDFSAYRVFDDGTVLKLNNVQAATSTASAKTRAINHERIEPGIYALEVKPTNSSSGTVDYNLFVGATPIKKEILTVKVERLTAIDSFDTGSQADFRVFLDVGRNTGKSKKMGSNDDDVFPNFELSDIRTSEFSRFIPIKIAAKDEDIGSKDEHVDLNRGSFFPGNALELEYDTLTGKVEDYQVSGFADGELITVTGNGGSDVFDSWLIPDKKRGRVQFRVYFNTYT